MRKQLCATERYYSALPPTDLLLRLANRLAALSVNSNGWGTTQRSLPFHEFEGFITGGYFAISPLPVDERRAYTFKTVLGVQLPQVEGWLLPGPAGGTLVQLRFHALVVPWWGVLLALLLLAWSQSATLETWPTAGQLGQFLAAGSVVVVGAWLASPLSLRLRMYQLRPVLAELFQLTASPAT